MIFHQHAATSMAIDSHLVVQLNSPIDRLHAAIARRSARAGSWLYKTAFVPEHAQVWVIV